MINGIKLQFQFRCYNYAKMYPTSLVVIKTEGLELQILKP